MQVLRAASPVDTPSLSPALLPEGEGENQGPIKACRCAPLARLRERGKPGAHQSLPVCSPRPLAERGENQGPIKACRCAPSPACGRGKTRARPSKPVRVLPSPACGRGEKPGAHQSLRRVLPRPLAGGLGRGPAGPAALAQNLPLHAITRQGIDMKESPEIGTRRISLRGMVSGWPRRVVHGRADRVAHCRGARLRRRAALRRGGLCARHQDLGAGRAEEVIRRREADQRGRSRWPWRTACCAWPTPIWRLPTRAWPTATRPTTPRAARTVLRRGCCGCRAALPRWPCSRRRGASTADRNTVRCAAADYALLRIQHYYELARRRQSAPDARPARRPPHRCGPPARAEPWRGP